MAEKHSIPTQERLKELFYYEPETGIFTRRITSGAGGVGKVAGSKNDKGYLVIEISGKKHGAHRLAWLYVYGVWPKEHTDHINGDRSDNRIANLREATKSENLQNQRRPSSNNKSGFLGVSRHGSKWRATISYDGVFRRLGDFTTPEMAHAAYLEAKRQHHEFCTI